jgi:AcrR family transcriptional regulator
MNHAEIAALAAKPESQRLKARREAFLAAGGEVFQEKGYAEATLDEVIARSGGSRQTLYAMFGGKQGLFEAIIADTCETIFSGLTPKEFARAPDEVLREVGARYLAIVTGQRCIALNRLIVAEAPRFPELAQQYWKLGPGRSRAFLAEFFESQKERGLLQVDDCAAAADHFLDMLAGTIRFQRLLGLREPPEPAEIARLVDDAVARFLHGSAIKAPPQGRRS